MDITPGKPEKNEPNLDCLSRELKEEISIKKLYNIRYYSEFQGTTP